MNVCNHHKGQKERISPSQCCADFRTFSADVRTFAPISVHVPPISVPVRLLHVEKGQLSQAMGKPKALHHLARGSSDRKAMVSKPPVASFLGISLGQSTKDELCHFFPVALGSGSFENPHRIYPPSSLASSVSFADLQKNMNGKWCRVADYSATKS